MPEIKLTLGNEPVAPDPSAVLAEAEAATATAVAQAAAQGLAVEAPVEEQKEEEQQPVFTEEEQAQIDEFSHKIDLTDTSMVFQYGAAAQKNIADFSDAALNNVRSKDLGEVGDMIAGLVTQLRSFSVDEEDKGGIFGFLKKIHCDTLYPYDLVRPYMRDVSVGWFSVDMPAAIPGEEVLDLMWDHLGGDVAGRNAISVIDTSGSMYWTRKGRITPAIVSQSLGLYFAEKCRGTFHNMFITFESRPHLIEIHGKTLRDKLRYIQTAPWGGSTDLEAVFDLILRAAVEADAPQEDMPATLYIISDMEFNVAMENPDKSIYEAAKEKFEASGYAMPAVVFQNVNSWQMQTPVRAHTRGTALASGAGTNNFKYKFDGNITPMDHMLRVLNGPRYAAVHA